MRSRSGNLLRDQQPESVESILRIWQHGALVGEGTARGALLADSMGLGKTAIAVVAAHRAGMHRVLVVCPRAALSDWRREIQEWHPLPGTIHTLGPGRPWLEFNNGFVLVNYESLEKYADDLRRRQWDLLIIDEAHALKEPMAKRTLMVYGGIWRDKPYRSIPARKALVISGTPLKNRVEELFTTLNFLDPDNWPDRDLFIDDYYESENDDNQPRIVTDTGRVVQNVATQNLDVLHRRLRETVLVRANKDDLERFPTKRFERVDVPLEDAADRDWFDRKALTALRVARMLRAAQRAGDLDRARELEEQARRLRSDITQHATRCKRQAVLDHLLSLPPEHKAIVVATHRDLFLDQLPTVLRERGRRFVVHNGDNSADAAATVRAFQMRPEIQFFLGQLNVSNLSLTLTAASHVVFAEIPATRADFDQAMDRVHRFGQNAATVTATVFVLDWPTAGDEDLLEALLHWKDISDTVLDGRQGGAAWEWTTPVVERSDPRMARWEARVLARARRLARKAVRAEVRLSSPGTYTTAGGRLHDEAVIDGASTWDDIEHALRYVGREDEFALIRQRAFAEIEMPSPRRAGIRDNTLPEFPERRTCIPEGEWS